MNSFGASDPIPEIHSGAAIRLGRPPAAPTHEGTAPLPCDADGEEKSLHQQLLRKA
jgi:hypothetical protein